MSNINGNKTVRELAGTINWDISRVKSKLREIGVLVFSNESEVDANDIERFYKHIGYSLEAENKKEEEDKSASKTANAGVQEGVISRTRSDYSGDYNANASKKQKQAKGGVAGTADSNLRSGYVTVTDEEREQYEALARKNAKAARAASAKDAGESAETASDEPETKAAERPRIRRRAANPGVSASTAGAESRQSEAAQPASAADAPSASSSEAESATQPAARTVIRRKASGAQEATPVSQGADETKAEEAAPVKEEAPKAEETAEAAKTEAPAAETTAPETKLEEAKAPEADGNAAAEAPAEHEEGAPYSADEFDLDSEYFAWQEEQEGGGEEKPKKKGWFRRK